MKRRAPRRVACTAHAQFWVDTADGTRVAVCAPHLEPGLEQLGGEVDQEHFPGPGEACVFTVEVVTAA